MGTETAVARRGAATALAAGLALAVAPSLTAAARAQETTTGTGNAKVAAPAATQNNEAARQRVAARVLALGVGLDWRKLPLADLQQIEKDLKATTDNPDAHARVIVAARLRELGINVDWHRFSSRQLADLYVTALGAEKGRETATADALPAPAAPPAPAAEEEPPAALVPPPPTYALPAPYDFGATNVLPPPSSVYYGYGTPPVYYAPPIYPSATVIYTRPYSHHHHGTTYIVPPAPQPYCPPRPPRPVHFHRSGVYSPTTIVTGGQYSRVTSAPSFVPNGRGGNIVPAPPRSLPSVPSFMPRTIVPAITRPITMPAPMATFGTGQRIGGNGFTPRRQQ